MIEASEIVLGAVYRDIVSDFIGIATAYYTYMNGCVRIELTGKVKGGEKDIPAFVFDIGQVARVSIPPVETKPRKTGGPVDHRPVVR